VAVDAGRLTLQAVDAPLVEVLEAIARAADLNLAVDDGLTGRVTQSFSGIALEEGIRRLCRGYSVALVYAAAAGNAEPELSEIMVIGGAPPSRPGASTATAAGSPRAARLREVQALGRRRDPDAARRLADLLLQEPDAVVRSQAVAAMGRVGGAATSAGLATALRDREAAVRMQAVRALSRVEGAEGIGTLRLVLTSDQDAGVRREAARALARFRTEAARAALEAGSADPDEGVRREVTRLLAAFSGRSP
jgi:HEAT repeat protein